MKDRSRVIYEYALKKSYGADVRFVKEIFNLTDHELQDIVDDINTEGRLIGFDIGKRVLIAGRPMVEKKKKGD